MAAFGMSSALFWDREEQRFDDTLERATHAIIVAPTYMAAMDIALEYRIHHNHTYMFVITSHRVLSNPQHGFRADRHYGGLQ